MKHESHTQPEQINVIRFLEAEAGKGARAERIDTHGAMIFLIGDLALKIKRAVKYDYMDLSTVEKRHALLDRELALNQPTALSIYRNVMPIVRRDDGTLALGVKGAAVEWVLVMNRFRPEAELTHIAARGGIDDDLAQALGKAIARYHRAAPARNLGGAVLIMEILEELGRVFATMPKSFCTDGQAWVAQARAIWSNQKRYLNLRSRQGHIRRCHGDLHLRNIVMIDGRPTPFDALEFDERLGTCDTLYDLAFLLMDLDHLGMRHSANLVLNAYLPATGAGLAQAGLSLLPLYLAVRAAIRAMVDMQTAAVSENSDSFVRDARGYLARAAGYLRPQPPVLVAIGGFSGTGKTTIARAVAHQIGAAPGAIHIRSDVVRKTLLHCDPLDHLAASGYSPQITDQTYAELRKQAGQILHQRHCAILDAVHCDPATRQAAQDVATATGCAFVGIWLDSPLQTRLDRVASRGPDASDADAHVVRRQADNDPGRMGWFRINTDQPLESVLKDVSILLDSALAPWPSVGGGENVG
ncbi:AAA family ATPase [Pseudorhodobacter sp. W20_MBD10_FR17]|uniref:bifunctional aminoglycoside phosphotransferase/ATP-binding protein n=1 Tax=Pseudorhodobacter sp. W20_MBD10_FR17 TaxID=3240266 RepID=UPI003F99276B